MQEVIVNHQKAIQKLRQMLEAGSVAIQNADPVHFYAKPLANKWSKVEILGHLIDSAINNLQRFTEIQYAPRPYNMRKYDQDALVFANDYQHEDRLKLMELWVSLNHRIIKILEAQTILSLSYEICIDDTIISLAFLMSDYVDHLTHHLDQILDFYY